MKSIDVYSVEEWEQNFDELLGRVENGEHIGIRNTEGQTAVMIPADDELVRLYTDHNEGS
jgi:antitoxin (DNA-binding transcriptional repressor) of toxin-antitoxin stability system